MLLDLLMGVMDSPRVWAEAAGSVRAGVAWRAAATARMRAAVRYVPYVEIVARAATDAGVDAGGPARLFQAWPAMRAWPDASAILALTRPYAFVTNCSRDLAAVAARRSGLAPRFVLSAEDAGRFKPAATVYLEACRRIGAEPRRTAFIAGSAYDAEGARDAGLDPWLVARRAEVRLPGVRVVSSFADVVSALERPSPQ